MTISQVVQQVSIDEREIAPAPTPRELWNGIAKSNLRPTRLRVACFLPSELASITHF